MTPKKPKKHCEHHISQTNKGISPNFGHRCVWVIAFAIKRLKFKVTAGSDPKNGVNAISL